MRILQVIGDVDSKNGGVVEAVRLISLALKARGHTVEVVSLDAPDSSYVSDFPFVVHAIGPGKMNYGYTPKLQDWICKHASNYDVAIVNGLWNYASVGGGRALHKCNLPYVLYTHGMLDPWFKQAYPFKHHLKQLFWWLFQGRVLTKSERVIFTALDEQNLAQGAFYGYAKYAKAVVALGCADPDIHKQDYAGEKFRQSVPLLGSSKFLLFLSRIHPKKGCDLLIEAFGDFALRNPDHHLVIAGPDQAGLVSSLKERAEALGFLNRLHFPGMLQGDEKWGAYLEAEAFVLPSHQENFGIVVAEALGSGAPVLTTDKVNIWREVRSSGAGYIEPDTQDGITALLTRWGDLTLDEKNQMGVCARQCFEKHFQLEAAANGLLDILREVSEGGSRK